MAEEEIAIDNELLIHLVQERPVLWDKSLETFKDRIATRNAWYEVCLHLKNDFDQLEDSKKNNFGRDVLKRWKHLRDAFVRSQKKYKATKASGSKASKMKKYIYNEELQFLQKIYEERETEESYNNEDSNIEELSGVGIQNAAGRLAKHMKIDYIKASDGWLYKFKSRHCLVDQVDGDEREMEELQDPLETPMNVAATSTKPTSVSPKRNIDSNARRQRFLEKAEKCLDQELQDPLETPMNAAAASAKRISVSPKRDLDRDTRRLRLLEKAEKFLDQEEDEYDGFGTYVTRKLRRLSETQRLSAEKEIMWKLLDLRSEEVVMNDEYLIELVRGYEELYDKNNRKYTDDYVKEGIWNSIGEELQKSGHECKSRWTSLIDQYQRYLKRCTARGGEEAARVPKWRYADEISFVRPYLRERDDIEYGSDDEPEHTGREDMLGATEQEQCESPGPTRHEVSSSKSCMKSKATVRSSKHVNPVGNDSENKEKHTDPIDLFFLSMAATVKKFTPYNRHICKTQVLSIVSGLELKELGTRAPFSTRSESRAQPRSPSPGNTSSCSSDAQYDMM